MLSYNTNIPDFASARVLMSFFKLQFLGSRPFWLLWGLLQRLRAPSQSLLDALFSSKSLLALTLTKVSSIVAKICDISWNLSKRGRESEERWMFANNSKKGCVQKIQPGLHHSHNGLYIDLYFVLGDNTRGEKKKRDAAFDQLTFWQHRPCRVWNNMWKELLCVRHW